MWDLSVYGFVVYTHLNTDRHIGFLCQMLKICITRNFYWRVTFVVQYLWQKQSQALTKVFRVWEIKSLQTQEGKINVKIQCLTRSSLIFMKNFFIPRYFENFVNFVLIILKIFQLFSLQNSQIIITNRYW